MADAVQTRIEREVRFASDVSHELRSPITALSAAVEVLDARRDDLPDRTQQALDVVVSQVRRFDDDGDRPARAVEDRRRRDRPHSETVDLVDLCDRVAAALRLRRTCRSTSIAARTRHAVVDRVRFERILGNLLENATTHGGGPLRISIEPSAAARARC